MKLVYCISACTHNSKATTKTPKHRPLANFAATYGPLLPTTQNEVVVSHLESERSPSSQEALAVPAAAVHVAGEDKAEKSGVFATSRGKQPS